MGLVPRCILGKHMLSESQSEKTSIKVSVTMASKQTGGADQRFTRVQKDPRFWEMPEKVKKIKIDKRFRSMFHDKHFNLKNAVDKRGRPVSHTSSEDLRRFYKLDSDEEDEEEAEQQEEEQIKGKRDNKDMDYEEAVAVGQIDEDAVEEEEEDEKGRGSEAGSVSEEESGPDSDSEPDLARGKGNVETSSEDEEDEVDALLRREAEQIQHDWGELCKDVRRSEEAWPRLAVCNMDWDRLKARDLLALLCSFVPQGGAVLSVKIYSSEFGRERLRMEETQGPMEFKALPEDSDEDTEEEKLHREKMRDYQFKRLKYYYAVVDCDSTQTAAKIYEECDGFEYESSCSMIDLRFIPDDITFDEEPVDSASNLDLSMYRPKLFSSSAAASSKVQLTWDETDHDRVNTLNRKVKKEELLEMDFKAYLASSSEGEEEGEEAELKLCEEVQLQKKKSEGRILKYRELLRGIQEKEKKLQDDKDMEIEITWVPGLRETTEQLVKKKLDMTASLTPWEEFLQKKKEHRKGKKSNSKQQEAPQDHLSKEDIPEDIDLSDPYFAEELHATAVKQKKKKRAEEPTAEGEELERHKAEMILLMDDGVDRHFNYNQIVEHQNLSQKKRRRLIKNGSEPIKEDDFQVDVSDPRFQAVFTSHLFNLDPSHPSYRRTRATKSIVAEKQRRRQVEGVGPCYTEDDLGAQMVAGTSGTQQEGTQKKTGSDCDAEKRPMDPSLSLLIKSVKNKTQQFQMRKKHKLS